MPAIKLSDVAAVLSPYDVVALGSPRLPTHAMLFVGDAVRRDVTTQTSIPVSHMRPPISTDFQRVQFAGSAELNLEERRLVKDFVDTQKRVVSSLKLRQRIEQYAIHQSSDEIHPDNTLPRFSCTTYVTSGYEQAAIQLIDSLIPMKTLDDLKRTYTDPTLLAALDDPARRVRIGIGAGDSWPVIMVGYLLHSLSRSPAEIRAAPYCPIDGDEYFPREPSIDVAPSVEPDNRVGKKF